MSFLMIGLVSASSNFDCKKQCNFIKSIDTKSCNTEYSFCKDNCEDSSCKRNCFEEKKECIKTVASSLSSCNTDCLYKDKNITCEKGKYNAGETFLKGCESCSCDYKGKVKCKKTDFCNFNNVSIEKESCLQSRGLFQALCNGPYFDVLCSQEKYCLCKGNNNYSCPSNSLCITNFIPPNKRIHTIEGWRSLQGFPLGDIGICANIPQIPSCGNGVCENVICKNCTTAETSFNCPNDCQ